MSRRPDEDPKSAELIELHTGDVQLIKTGEAPVASGETPIATRPAEEKPFDPDATLPMPDPAKPLADLARQEQQTRKKSFDPEVTDKGAFRPPKDRPDRPADLPPPEELVTDPTGRSQPSGPLKPARLFDGVPMQSTSGERPLDVSLPGRTVLPPPPVSDPAFLCVTRGPGQGTSVAVPDGEHPIGRSASCFLCLAHTSVSREHALFKRVGNQFYIRDAASGGGTKINGVRLEGTAEVVPGDQIQIGTSVLVLRHGPVVGPEMTDPLGFTVGGQPSRKSSGPWLWVGAIATAFASAALASVLLTPAGERLFAGAPRTSQPAAAPTVTAPEVPKDSAPLHRPTSEAEVDSADVNLDSDIQIRTSRRIDPANDPALEPVGAVRSHPAKPAPRPRPTAVLVPPAPKPTAPTSKASEALRLFNEGEVEASINAAKSSGSAALALKLANFRKEAALAETSRQGGDAMGAVRHLSAAAAIDESLTRGWSKPGTEVRAELTRLLVSLSEKALGAGDAAQAAVFAEKALVYGPGNDKATALLKDAKARKAASGAAAAAPQPAAPQPAGPQKDSRSAADKAFEPEPAAPGAPAKNPRSEADKAFED